LSRERLSAVAEAATSIGAAAFLTRRAPRALAPSPKRRKTFAGAKAKC
jgi:hypothetical protein